MNTMMIRVAAGLAGAGALLAAQPAMAETINMICKYQAWQGYSDMEVIWADTATNQVKTVLSYANRPGFHGLNGGANTEDALNRAKKPAFLKKWPAVITATSIKWTSNDSDVARPVEINRQTGVLTWSTPTDPTPPSQGTATCTQGDLVLPPPEVLPKTKAPLPVRPH